MINETIVKALGCRGFDIETRNGLNVMEWVGFPKGITVWVRDQYWTGKPLQPGVFFISAFWRKNNKKVIQEFTVNEAALLDTPTTEKLKRKIIRLKRADCRKNRKNS